MFKKILIGLAIFTGTSWTIYGASMNALTLAKADYAKSHGGSEEECKIKMSCALIQAYKNFKEAVRLQKES